MEFRHLTRSNKHIKCVLDRIKINKGAGTYGMYCNSKAWILNLKKCFFIDILAVNTLDFYEIWFVYDI